MGIKPTVDGFSTLLLLHLKQTRFARRFAAKLNCNNVSMYVPPQFAAKDPAHAIALVLAHPFASLISLDDEGLRFVTSVPLHRIEKKSAGCCWATAPSPIHTGVTCRHGPKPSLLSWDRRPT
jgi:hypothetical protein